MTAPDPNMSATNSTLNTAPPVASQSNWGRTRYHAGTAATAAASRALTIGVALSRQGR